jgi:hypothetical protein
MRRERSRGDRGRYRRCAWSRDGGDPRRQRLTVVAVDRNEHALRELHGSVRPEVADAADPAAANSLIDRIAGEVGPPDVLVNTIGAFRPGDALSTTPDTLPRLTVTADMETVKGTPCREPSGPPLGKPGGCRSYLQGMPWRTRLTPCRPRHSLPGFSPAHAASTTLESP